MQCIAVRAVVPKAPVAFNGHDANRHGGDEVVDQHAGEHEGHERNQFIGTPQQNMNRIVDSFRDGNRFHNDLQLG